MLENSSRVECHVDFGGAFTTTAALLPHSQDYSLCLSVPAGICLPALVVLVDVKVKKACDFLSTASSLGISDASAQPP
jgi:hypothetical protein